MLVQNPLSGLTRGPNPEWTAAACPRVAGTGVTESGLGGLGTPQRTAWKDMDAERLDLARYVAQGLWDTLTSSTPSPPSQVSVRVLNRWTGLSRQAMRHRKEAEGDSPGERRSAVGMRTVGSKKRPQGMLEVVVPSASVIGRCLDEPQGPVDYNSRNPQRTVLKSFPLHFPRLSCGSVNKTTTPMRLSMAD